MWFISYFKWWYCFFTFTWKFNIYFVKQGNIYTNYQLDSFKNGFFSLTLYAADDGYPPLNTTLETLVIIKWIYFHTLIFLLSFLRYFLPSTLKKLVWSLIYPQINISINFWIVSKRQCFKYQKFSYLIKFLFEEI